MQTKRSYQMSPVSTRPFNRMVILMRNTILASTILATMFLVGGALSQACGPGGACFDTPGLVDEEGDEMGGDLTFIEDSKTRWTEEGSREEEPTIGDSTMSAMSASAGRPDSFISASGAELHMPVLHTADLTFTGGAGILIEDGGDIVLNGGGDIIQTGQDMVFSTEEDFQIDVGGANALFIESDNQNVGIGTKTPAAALDVNGNIVPTHTDEYGLGQPDRRWHYLYMASVLDYKDQMVFQTTIGGVPITSVVMKPGATDVTGDLNVGGVISGDGSGLTNLPLHWDDIDGKPAVTWGAIEDVPADIADGDHDSLASLQCVEGQTLRFSASGWLCHTAETTNKPAFTAQVAPLDGDRGGKLLRAGGSSAVGLCSLDLDGDGLRDANEPLLLRTTSSTCITARDLDIVLVAGASISAQAAGYTGTPLLAPTALGAAPAGNNGAFAVSFHDADGDGAYGRGEDVWLDVDGDGVVSPGDYSFTDGPAAQAGPQLVLRHDWSMHEALAFWPMDDSAEMDDGSLFYLDLDRGRAVSVNDVRLSDVS